MNDYYAKIKFVEEKLCKYLSEIFKVYGNELLLRLEEYNLLQSKYNCIESSTATGFIIEEFVVSKLETYTQHHNNAEEIKVERISNHGTQGTSYDCFVNYKNVFFMINVKGEKTANNGVAAINLLYNDYSVVNTEKEKSFLVLKIQYDYGESQRTKERKIMIHGSSIYALEEIDFSAGYEQDYRNWSSEAFKAESGRLQIKKTFLAANKLDENDISYLKTKEFINIIYNTSKSKQRKSR